MKSRSFLDDDFFKFILSPNFDFYKKPTSKKSTESLQEKRLRKQVESLISRGGGGWTKKKKKKKKKREREREREFK